VSKSHKKEKKKFKTTPKISTGHLHKEKKKMENQLLRHGLALALEVEHAGAVAGAVALLGCRQEKKKKKRKKKKKKKKKKSELLLYTCASKQCS
jgi:hypothetical protein